MGGGAGPPGWHSAKHVACSLSAGLGFRLWITG